MLKPQKLTSQELIDKYQKITDQEFKSLGHNRQNFIKHVLECPDRFKQELIMSDFAFRLLTSRQNAKK